MASSPSASIQADNVPLTPAESVPASNSSTPRNLPTRLLNESRAPPRPMESLTLEKLCTSSFVDETELQRMGGTSDEDLLNLFTMLVMVDEGVKDEALAAYNEMKNTPESDTEAEPAKPPEVGMVNRRAPLNPLASPRLEILRRNSIVPMPEKQHKPKVADPALKNNPLRGRLVMMLCSTAALFMIFLQALANNKVLHGSFHAKYSDNPMIGPEGMVLYELGGLNANRIRNNGEVFRLFWAMWMHSGWIHIGLNLLSQLQYFFIFEPDWGFFKVSMTFWIAGITGNLLSAVTNPCSTTVGSSGALFGLMGAMIPYCVEFWTTIPRPLCMIVFSLIVAIISLVTGFSSNTDNWAHMGGFIGGVCFCFATISSLEPCRGITKKLPKGQPRETAKSLKSTTDRHDGPSDSVVVVVDGNGLVKKQVVGAGRTDKTRKRKPFARYKCGKREWIIRCASLVALVATWVTCCILLFKDYEYQPLGQVTFSGISSCCCCYTAVKEKQWMCNPCDFEGWGNYCALSLAKKKNHGLKSQYANASLFEALGLHDMYLQPLTPVSDGSPITFEKQMAIISSIKPTTNTAILAGSAEVGSRTLDFQQSQSPQEVESFLPFADLLPALQGRESEISRLAGVDRTSRNLTDFFEEPLSFEEVEWIRFQELRHSQRSMFFRDVLKHFVKSP